MSWSDHKADAAAPLSEARRLQQAAAELGFDWPDLPPLWDKLEEELGEFREAVDSGDSQAMQDELGDLLFMLVNFSRFLKLSPEQALDSVNRKFIRRLRHVEHKLTEHGRDWADCTLDELEAWWQDAKTNGPEV
ncbi:nucleoside triphosphate pyrophosphohydrolase [Oceanococcus atlanticus]|uniref:Nucleoside triphosphate pyrophosphohydrolase n=1 Tax=Oceanococcus atlanticus TaxID=1317117 RepID=A0A1Y1SC82_9GAMM|nr:MazG nucleotide pyrophosphohydrolase domain-containing protein [Oceanococcus atlanticus]ORE86231.1 nucleoside triphosphate pyrophosphohydrolase [Oceanococcus atlanticus]RZO85967.1 MAG: hypothetical protein EVA65_03260 [Oceanococcus sp.]